MQNNGTLRPPQLHPDLCLELRYDWTLAEVLDLLQQPLLDLVYRSQIIHRQYHPDPHIQLATLLSVKTGGCAEDCGYCAQSAHHSATSKQPTLQVTEVLEAARRAQALGATRFCMGWAWREIREGPAFEAMLEMIRGVHQMGLEVCVTAGMLNQNQAQRLAAAGLTAYNHNLDTSPEFYPEIVSTRTYTDRLQTLNYVRQAGITVCCGGIIGLGETERDRAHLLQILATFNPHPESVPINALVAIPGTPLQDQSPVDPLALVRMCATARILMPRSKIRLSAGRTELTREAQVLCILAGVNSIFYGDKLLTVENPDIERDRQLLKELGLHPLEPFYGSEQP
jgi:biotin synthase